MRKFCNHATHFVTENARRQEPPRKVQVKVKVSKEYMNWKVQRPEG